MRQKPALRQNEVDNEAIRAASPALDACLSDLGRRVAFPPDIPFQAGQARGKRFNATIGQITRSDGRALALPVVDSLLGLAEGPRNRAELYSPVEGHRDVREAWRDWQRRGGVSAVSGLPIVTVGLTHGLSLVADLFGGPGRPVAVPSPFWGNYRQTFAGRTGAELLSAPAYVDGAFSADAIERALAERAPGEPALAIVNAPSNPGGYSPSTAERRALLDSLLRVADSRPLIVICDDAYAGLVYEQDVPAESLFWDLIGLHGNLVPIKVDGATKEFGLFGGRVGFLTFPFEPGSPVSQALESKVKCLTRATIGSPVSLSQILLLEALTSGEAERQIEAVRAILEARYRTLQTALAGVDRGLLTPLPFNSGCFALVELRQELGLDSEMVRRHLLEEQEVGLIAIAPRFLRIAFCSVDEEALPTLVRRLETGLRELAAD